jgi:hypothetical protein
MRQRNGFNQVFVQPKRTGNRPSQLCDLEGMRHTGAEKVTFVIEKNLGLVHQSAKS